MSKYKAGDKIVMEIAKSESNGHYGISTENNTLICFVADHFDMCAKPLSEYTEKLEKKNQNKQKRIEKLVERLHRQAAEITRLLAENEDLKNSMEIIRDNAFEAGQVKGQNDAWELAQKIYCMPEDGGFYPKELIAMFGTVPASSILRSNTYQEAAAKVAEWERQKEEICVGDIICIEGKCGVVIYAGDYIKGITENGTDFCVTTNVCTKTGRHIDVNAWLAQIGGEK